MRVLKWIIGINDEPWAIGSGDVVLIGQQEGALLGPSNQPNDRIQIWTVEPDEGGGTRYVQVFGTGQHLPEHTDPWGGSHIGSLIAGEAVWHVFEVDAPDLFGKAKPNDAVNVQFPECPECGAPPGQAHDPTCTVKP